MATEKNLKVYGLLKLPTQIIKDAILFIKGVNDTKVTAYVTDENGTPFPLKSGDMDTEVLIPTLISGQSGNSLVISAEDDKLYVPPPEPSVTNLDTTPSPTNIEITNDNGDGFTLELADNTNAGLFSPGEKSKLASITEIFTTTLKTAYDGVVTWIATNGANILNHLSNTSNPHNTTAAQVGAPSGSGTSTGSNTGDETTITILNKIGDGSTISSSYLPAYVDDVLEFTNFAALPVTGEQGIIYVTEDTNYSYRWSGSAYISLSNPLDYASQLEAEGNSENTKVMTSLRVFQNWFNNVSNYVLTALNTSSKTIVGAINELFSNKLDKLSVSYNSSITKTLDLNDVNKRIVFVNTNAKTLTIPTNAATPIPVGSKIEITQYSTGSINLSYDISVTVVSNIGFSTELNGTYILTKIGTDTWTFDGFVATGAKQPFTVFINTISGNNSTGQVEDRTKPFLTDVAAFNALPIDDGNVWTFSYTCNGVTRNLTQVPTARKIKYESYNTGTFNISSWTGSVLLPLLNFNIPNATLKHENVLNATLTSPSTAYIKAKVIDIRTPAATSANNVFQVDGDYIAETIIERNNVGKSFARGTIITTVLDTTSTILFFNSGSNRSQIGQLVLNGQNCVLSFGIIFDNIPIKSILGTGTLNTTGLLRLDVSNLTTTSGINILIYAGTVLTGFTNTPFLGTITVAHQSTAFIDNFYGKINVINGSSGFTFNATINDSTIFLDGLFFTGWSGSAVNRNWYLRNVEFIQITPGNLLANMGSGTLTVYKTGYIKTNGTFNPTIITDRTPNSF